jgi:hypothetical protein
MPPSFFAVAVRRAESNFAYRVAKDVNSPPSNDLSAVLAASGFLVPFGNNRVGQSNSFCFAPRLIPPLDSTTEKSC